MAKRDTTVYTMRGKYGRIQKYGVTNDPIRREAENRRDGVRGALRPEGPKRTRESALREERRRINQFRDRTGRRPPRNRM